MSVSNQEFKDLLGSATQSPTEPASQPEDQPEDGGPQSPQTNNDVIDQLINNKNPLPILAILDQIDPNTKTEDGIPILNQLSNKFLPLESFFGDKVIKFQSDLEGRTPLHYAVAVDDIKAANWLLSRGAQNTLDKYGNSPVMDALRLGHRRSFMLCLHYQHINESLPHIGAQYNRVWQLKAMLALGLNLGVKNSKSRTPLEIAVENYSYEAAEYLAQVTRNYSKNQLAKLTDSKAIMKRVDKGKKRNSKLHRAFFPLFNKLSTFAIILSAIYFNPIYSSSQHQMLTNCLIYSILFSLLFVFNFIFKQSEKTPDLILTLLRQPDFPSNIDNICPSTLTTFDPNKEDYCDICHINVSKLHQHNYVCINKSNEFIWYLLEFFTLYMFYTILSTGIRGLKVENDGEGKFWTVMRSLYICFFNQQKWGTGVFLLFLIAKTIEQILFTIQLFGMAFMSRTYLQVTRSQEYPHLFTTFKSKAGKFKNRQFRLFYSYKLCGGVIMGIRNIVLYFF